MTQDPDLELLYVADPMCSWCWGFAPTIERIARRFAFPLTVVAGGLRPGEAAQPLDDGMRAMLRHHWQEVEAASGQSFDHRVLQRPDGWLYDTLVPDTAVVTMRALRPERTLDFLARLQRAFYAERVDITDRGVYPDLISGFDVDGADFVERLASDAMARETWQDFATARSFGVTGFPTLLLRDGETAYPVTRGYQTYDVLEGGLCRFLEAEHPEQRSRLVREILEGPDRA